MWCLTLRSGKVSARAKALTVVRLMPHSCPMRRRDSPFASILCTAHSADSDACGYLAVSCAHFDSVAAAVASCCSSRHTVSGGRHRSLGSSRRRRWARRRVKARSSASRRLRSRCQRSATCSAPDAPAVAPWAYSVERSRAMVRTPGWVRSQCWIMSAVRSGTRSTGQYRSRSPKMVPKRRPFRSVKASVPRTRGGVAAGSGVARTIWSRVSRLVGNRRRVPA